MKNLKDVIEHACAIAFEEDVDQKVGIDNNGDLVIRSWEDPNPLNAELRITSTGVHPNFINVTGGIDEDWNFIA